MSETATTPPASIVEATTPLVASVDEAIERAIAGIDLPPNLVEAVRYAVLGGGKRLRPILALLACEAVGGDREAAMAPAVAIELVHAFSLVHDDLPALDDDDLRRGRPTVHRVYGEAMAILVGDALLSLAIQVLADARPELVSELITANTRMIAGQVYDTLGGFAPETVDDADRLELIHTNKTGALLVAACRMGARAGGADPARLTAIATYGEVLGLMFQIVDDLLDVTQSAEHVGKATGKDQAANKLTFPGVMGVERSREEVRELNARARAALEPLGDTGRMLRELADYMAVRTK